METLEDSWVWISLAAGLLLSNLACLIARWGIQYRNGRRARGDAVWQRLELVFNPIVVAIIFACILSYLLFLRSYFFIPPPETYALGYAVGVALGAASGWFWALREFN